MTRTQRRLPAIIIVTLVVTIGAAFAGNTWTDGADQPHRSTTTTVVTP